MSTVEAAPDERLAAGVRLVQAGRLREAEEVFRYILQRDPADPDALCGLAAVALVRGDAQSAFDILSRARAAHPKHNGVLGALANAHYALGRPQEALTCVDAAIHLAPEAATHRLTRAQLLMQQQRPADAIADLDAGLAVDGRNADLLNAKGTALMGLGRKAEGADHFARAHEADPSRADAPHNLALALTELGRPGEAIVFAERAYLNEPADPSYRVSLARRRLAVGQLAAAREAAQAAVALAPLDIAANEALGDCLVLAGEAEKAFAQLATLVRQTRSSSEACLALARVLYRGGRLEQALAAAGHARRAAPDDIRTAALERDLNLALGRFAEAFDGGSPGGAEPAAFSTHSVSLGDALFCARWLRPGATLHCRAAEAPLLAGLAGITIVAEDDSDRPSIASLTRELERGPPPPADWKPYLGLPEAQASRWRQAVASWPAPRIGLIWSGAPYDVSLAALDAALAGLGTVISLVAGPLSEPLPAYPHILDGGAHIASAVDLAAAIAAVDVVVTPDHLAAHLAGALGKTGIVAVPAGRPWQWRSEDGRSLWYPTLDVVAQTRAGNWDTAMTELRSRLEGSAVSAAQLVEASV